jgi:hypothetical protein
VIARARLTSVLAIVVGGAIAITPRTRRCCAGCSRGTAARRPGAPLRLRRGVVIGGAVLIAAARIALDDAVAAVVTATGCRGRCRRGSRRRRHVLARRRCVAGLLILLGGAFALATAHRWRSGGRRYQRERGHADSGSRPHDAIDAWDDLSHGDDPTAR